MAMKNIMDTYKKYPNEAVAQVVASYAQRSDVTADDIVELAQRLMPVFTQDFTQDAALAPDQQPATAPVAAPAPARFATPALPLEKAVTDEKVYCLCCGKGFTMLKRHLKAEHGLTEDEYRQKFGLADDFPLVAPNYSKRKAAYAKDVGLGKYNRDAAPEQTVSAS